MAVGSNQDDEVCLTFIRIKLDDLMKTLCGNGKGRTSSKSPCMRMKQTAMCGPKDSIVDLASPYNST